MHKSSYEIMKWFVNKYDVNGKVLDIGSRDVNGTYRDLFQHCNYVGMDIVNGNNVDVVVSKPYYWEEFKDCSFDSVICGSVIEHTKFPWLIFEEIERILKSHGKFCVIAPTVWCEHDFPYDCFRYYPSGMKALCEWSGLKCLESDYKMAYDEYENFEHRFYDCYVVGEKV